MNTISLQTWALTLPEYLQKLREGNDYPVMDSLWERVRTGDHRLSVQQALEYNNTVVNHQRGTRSEFRAAISEGLINARRAIEIIQSAKLEVPADILKMTN